MISVRHLNKVYSTRQGKPIHALADINLDIAHGEFVSVVGASGCGKTTLLKIMAGILPRTSGEVLIDGKLVDRPSPQFGVVFQEPLLLPWRNTVQNIRVPIEIQRRDRAEFEVASHELLRLVGLRGFERRYPAELSGGMQQRVGIARALAHDPDFLLMDEPFGALDAMTREQLNLDLLEIWRERRKTIFLITHSIAEAVFLADRIVVMGSRPGHIAEIIDVGLPRPRNLEIINSDSFGIYVRRVRAHFGSRGMDA